MPLAAALVAVGLVVTAIGLFLLPWIDLGLPNRTVTFTFLDSYKGFMRNETFTGVDALLLVPRSWLVVAALTCGGAAATAFQPQRNSPPLLWLAGAVPLAWLGWLAYATNRQISDGGAVLFASGMTGGLGLAPWFGIIGMSIATVGIALVEGAFDQETWNASQNP